MNVAGKLCVSVQKRELFDIARSELAGHETQSQKCRLFSKVARGGSRVRFMPADLDALIARLVAMKELADKTAQVLAPVVKK